MYFGEGYFVSFLFYSQLFLFNFFLRGKMNIKLVEHLRKLNEEDLFPNTSEEETKARGAEVERRKALAIQAKREFDEKLPQLAQEAADKLGTVILRKALNIENTWIIRTYKIFSGSREGSGWQVASTYSKVDAEKLMAVMKEICVDKNYYDREDADSLHSYDIARILEIDTSEFR